jgi:hypothetical protein
MVKKLRNLIISEVSLVGKGANPHAHILLCKRDDSDEIETPQDSDRNFNASGRGPMHDKLLISYDNYRRAMGPAQASRAFEMAWDDLTDSEKNEIRAEEQSTEAAREAAAAAEEKERAKDMMKTMNDDSKIQEVVKLAHDIDSGRMSHNFADRASWYGAITKIAETQRKPNESSQQSFARFITEDADGKVMFKCYQTSAGSDYVAPAPEPAPVIKADSAYGRLKKIAADLCAETPGLTSSAAFVKVFTDPANRELAQRSKTESAFA